MLSKNREKLIRSLHRKKGREESGLLLVEGSKMIETAGDAIEFSFTREMTPIFDTLVTTETPQDVAAVARIPAWSEEDVLHSETIVVLDGVQDPGNVGAALRLCLGFGATLVLIESADVTSPKVVRASAGALFHVPWIKIDRSDWTDKTPKTFVDGRTIYRLEKREGAEPVHVVKTKTPALIIAGSEGLGITLNVEGTSIFVPHNDTLESLNVTHALAIALHERFTVS